MLDPARIDCLPIDVFQALGEGCWLDTPLMQGLLSTTGVILCYLIDC
jgi:hypothetical protein